MIDTNNFHTLPKAQQNMNLGTAYKVTSSQGVESYVIGTSHYADAKMIQQSCFHRIINKCSTLYTELGTSVFLNTCDLNIPERDHAYRHIKYRFMLDTAITLEALSRKIPIISLDFDRGIASKDADKNWWIEQVNKCSTQSLENSLMHQASHLPYQLSFIAGHSHVLKGEVEALAAMRTPASQKEHNADFREESWCQVLIPELLKTQKPICVAVGAIHLVGKDGLMERFRKAGFHVEQIRSDCAQFAPPAKLAPRFFFSSPGWLPSLIKQSSHVWQAFETYMPSAPQKLLKVASAKRNLVQQRTPPSKRSRITKNSMTQAKKITNFFRPSL